MTRSRIDVSLSVSPIRNTAGEIIGAAKVARTYAEVNQLFGDIVKVTPSSGRSEIAGVFGPHAQVGEHLVGVEPRPLDEVRLIFASTPEAQPEIVARVASRFPPNIRARIADDPSDRRASNRLPIDLDAHVRDRDDLRARQQVERVIVPAFIDERLRNLDRHQPVHACDRGVDAAVEPERFLAGVGIGTPMHHDPFAHPIVEVIIALGPQEELPVLHLPAHLFERPPQQVRRNRAEPDPGFALQQSFGGQFCHGPPMP